MNEDKIKIDYDDESSDDYPEQQERKPSNNIAKWLVGCSVFILLCIILIVAVAIPQLLNARKSAWENRCKLALRSMGVAQLTYIDTTKTNIYGNFEALQETGFIPEGYSRENLIENYNIVTFTVDPPSKLTNGLPAYDPTFKIIAVPRDQRSRLRTFAIREDQTLRVWAGDDSEFDAQEEALADSSKWSPLR